MPWYVRNPSLSRAKLDQQTSKLSLPEAVRSIEKLDANEKMGIIGKSDGACRIIAYSEVSANLQNQKEADGKTLTFRQGCITNHVVSA